MQKTSYTKSILRGSGNLYLANIKIMLMKFKLSQELFIAGVKFLQVIYISFDCDLTHGFLIHDFNK